MPRPRKPASPFRYFHSSSEVIRLVVYVRFPLSLRNVEDLLFDVGLTFAMERCGCGGNALARCSQPTSLITPDDDRALTSAAGEEWCIEIGPVDLAGRIVTIQRGDDLIAALASRDDGRLRLAAYRPLDATSANPIIASALGPRREDGTVCMRGNN